MFHSNAIVANPENRQYQVYDELMISIDSIDPTNTAV